MLTNFQLTGRGSTFWNEVFPSIGVGMGLRDLPPKELIYFGLYTLSKLVIKLKAVITDGSFYNSKELLATYDSFGDEERAQFEKKYEVGKSKEEVLKDYLKFTMENAGDKDAILQEHDRTVKLHPELN